MRDVLWLTGTEDTLSFDRYERKQGSLHRGPPSVSTNRASLNGGRMPPITLALPYRLKEDQVFNHLPYSSGHAQGHYIKYISPFRIMELQEKYLWMSSKD